jgi:hypothetical protein
MFLVKNQKLPKKPSIDGYRKKDVSDRKVKTKKSEIKVGLYVIEILVFFSPFIYIFFIFLLYLPKTDIQQ